MNKIKVEPGDFFGAMTYASIKSVKLNAGNVENYDLHKMTRKSNEEYTFYKLKHSMSIKLYIYHEHSTGKVDWVESLEGMI